MFHRLLRRSSPACCLSIVLVSALLVSSSAALAQTTPTVAVAVSAEVSAMESSLINLRALFSMRKRSWNNSKPVTVFVLPDQHPLHREFCRTVLRMYPYVLRDHWDRMIFSGAGAGPQQLDSEAEMRAALRDTPGAIGYITAPPGAGGKILFFTGDGQHVELGEDR